VYSPHTQGVYNMCVSQLMMDGEKRWNVDKIYDLFTADVGETILGVPLFESVMIKLHG